MKKETREDVLEWIDFEQLNNEGIYPYPLAEKVSRVFSIPMDDAIHHVLVHIKSVFEANK